MMVNKKQIRELLNESACAHNKEKKVVVISQNLEQRVVAVHLKEPK